MFVVCCAVGAAVFSRTQTQLPEYDCHLRWLLWLMLMPMR